MLSLANQRDKTHQSKNNEKQLDNICEGNAVHSTKESVDHGHSSTGNDGCGIVHA